MNASGSWAEREAELVELELSAILAVASEAPEAFWASLPTPSSPRELWAMMFAGVEAVCQLAGFIPREKGSDPIRSVCRQTGASLTRSFWRCGWCVQELTASLGSLLISGPARPMMGQERALMAS